MAKRILRVLIKGKRWQSSLGHQNIRYAATFWRLHPIFAPFPLPQAISRQNLHSSTAVEFIRFLRLKETHARAASYGVVDSCDIALLV